MTTTLTPSGLIEIPEAFRKADDLRPGQRCDIERTGRGEYRVRINDAGAERPREKLIDVLMSCPVKGWFHAMDRTETTDDLKPVVIE